MAGIKVRAAGNADRSATTDEGGVAVIRLQAGAAEEAVEIEASDKEGNHTSSTVHLDVRAGADQILLRTEHAVYRAGDHIVLRVFSTKNKGTAYLDVVKEGQTVLTRDVDIVNGQAELTLAATPDLAGAVDIGAYLFGRDAQPIGDHRLVFVQPADELKIETTADAPVHKPGDEARVSFQVTNSRGEGVQAALGLQVVDEAVFALAEKQPGFAKVFFYLEQEAMKPRYEIHSIGMPDIVEPVAGPVALPRDRAARALFSATELVSGNKFETEFGRTVPLTKYAEYSERYQTRYRAQLRQLAEAFTRTYAREGGDLTKVAAKLTAAGMPELRDAWGNGLRLEPVDWIPQRNYYLVRSAGPDKQFDTADDLTGYLEVRGRKTVGSGSSGPSRIEVNVESERGPYNGLAEISGTVVDQQGGALEGATATVQAAGGGAPRATRANSEGRFTLSGLPPGNYDLKVSSGAETVSRRVALQARDRGVVSAIIRQESGGSIVVAEPPARMMVRGNMKFARLMRADVGAAIGGIVGGVVPQAMMPMSPPALPQRVAMSTATLAKVEPAVPAVHVRSYFPEALYINPEIITDQNGAASIAIPLADSITTWRMAMMASTMHGALGSAVSSLKVFQDFFVDLDLPVTLTQGDRVSVPVAVYNYSAARGDVRLELKTEDWFALVDDAPGKTVAVDSGRVGASQFTLEARRIGKFKLTLAAHMNGGLNPADIVVREIEVDSQWPRAVDGVQRAPGDGGGACREVPAGGHCGRQ